MLISNLMYILAEKRLKIADLVRDTGISRPTLTALYHNNGKGINFDTLETLCKYLKITPGELILFFDIDVDEVKVEYTGFTKDDFTVSPVENSLCIPPKSCKPFIADANFKGLIKFKQNNLPLIEFNGWISALRADGKFTAIFNLLCDENKYPQKALQQIVHADITQALITKFETENISITPLAIKFNDVELTKRL